jgi:FkbM family methyltransferase
MLIRFEHMPCNKIRGIIHVGAHEAEELPQYVQQGVCNVLWVEANPEKWSLLLERIEPYQDMQLGGFAASSSTGNIGLLNIANNGQSSSLLDLGSHAMSYPDIEFRRKISVDLRAIDDWLEELRVKRASYNFINLDIQGYELNALHGMERQLEYVDFVYTEVNFEEVYLGCAKLEELEIFLFERGFKRVMLANTGAGWGDAFYARKNVWRLRRRLQLLKLISLVSRATAKITSYCGNKRIQGLSRITKVWAAKNTVKD